jgi:hypothetical protein
MVMEDIYPGCEDTSHLQKPGLEESQVYIPTPALCAGVLLIAVSPYSTPG